MLRSKKGVVVSDKMDKTVVIVVHTYKMHPKYKKRYRTSSKFHAHDPNNQYKIGDEITIYETRPLSKLKRWTVVEPAKK
jgi:small subunit ribosomal protein S17